VAGHLTGPVAPGLAQIVALTGGDGSRILMQLDGNVLHRPHLVLQGLAHVLRSKS